MALPPCLSPSRRGGLPAISPCELPSSTQGRSWYGGPPPTRPCTGRDGALTPTLLPGQPAPAAPHSPPFPGSPSSHFPREQYPGWQCALQGRHLLRWVLWSPACCWAGAPAAAPPGLAPDRWRLAGEGSPRPGLQALPGWAAGQHLEASSESYKSPMRSHVGRCLSSTQLRARPAGGARLRRQFLVMPLPTCSPVTEQVPVSCPGGKFSPDFEH